MLLEFKARNYKSFKDELCLSMIPDDDETALDYSVMTEHVAGETPRALCSTVVYGPNASGKTNVISALDTFRKIVLRGNLSNEKVTSENPAASKLELIPNNTAETSRPVEFSIQFITSGVLIDYAFSADLGGFLQEDYDRKILSETLCVNNIPIFTRVNGMDVSADSLKKFPEFFKANIPANLDAIRTLPGWDVEAQQLFLCNGFSSLLSQDLYKLVAEWLSEHLMTFCRSDTLSVMFDGIVEPNQTSTMMAEKNVNAAVACIGARNMMGYVYDSQKKRVRLASLVARRNDENVAIPAQVFESYGTYRFANLFPLLAEAIFSGGTLALDEFDASLHPMVLMNIINLFHNPEINRSHAQLIFNTHNPIFLDRSLFRRDEIKFVERNEETQSSELYALSDFEPERDCEDYLGNYFRDRYGAIQYVDLTPVFRKIVEPDSDKEAEG